MKRIYLIFFALIASTALWAQTATSHFITDASYRQVVEKAYNNKVKLIGKNVSLKPQGKLSAKEQEALKFLYAYMPLADALDYSPDFYLASIRSTFRTRQEMAWGKKVPELLFRHFVLPLRVNNENLDSARIVFYKELKERVKGKTMAEAILEVNHWCHEHVTYVPSDARTLSPIACLRNALGRCGEESTFTVAALRSIGIPARQVYTPRWAHTDDNHAWVEAWADGKWYFLGACEPEAVLNLGWFNAPASRALLTHTRAFGDYRGPEEVMLRTSNYTEINLIDNYAKTARVDFKVVDTDGKPVSDARVEFKIYNYAEYYTAVNKYTDQQGRTFLTAGMGDMVVWASKNGNYGFAKASFGTDKLVTITLNHNASVDKSQTAFAATSMNIVPPAEHAYLPDVPAELAKANKVRFAREDSIRKAYEKNTFYNGETDTQLGKYLKTARSNWRTIKAFYDKHSDKARALKLLGTLSDKDLRDMPMAILDDSYNAPGEQLCPRVENEMIIRPFKQELSKVFPKAEADAFRKDPSKLVAWVKKNIRLNPDRKALRIAQTPMGTWQARVTDTRSRDIFFVDLARSLNIDARKDVVTSKVQYRVNNGPWVDVDFDAQSMTTAKTGTLKLTFTPTKYIDDPKYYSHFSISRIDNGHATLLNFDEGQVDMGGGTSWSNTFKNGTKLDEGTYLLVTGTRLASGTVLSSNRIFNIKAGETTTLPLELRTSESQVSVIGSFDSESRYRLLNGKEVSILSQTGRGYFVVGLLGVGQEPTNHALKDIEKVKTQIEEWGRPLLLLFDNEREAEFFRHENFNNLPKTTIYGIDKNGSIRKQIAAQMKLPKASLSPIFFISDTFNRVVFCSQGYTIGLGEQLLRTIKGLN